jgi:DNA-binding transcriptional LysR family regulator
MMGFDGRLLSGMSLLATVVETGSFTRAGDVLGLSPSGVSRAVSRLEERMGVRLLDRTTRALHLTGEGARLYELAAPHLSGIEEAANVVSGAAATVRGTLRVSLNPLFSRHVLAPRLPEFTERYPEIELISVLLPDAGDLVAEGIDVAVRFGPQPPSSMTSRLLLETRVLTVASPSYLKKHGRPKRPERLAEHDCIQYIDPQRGKPFEWEFHCRREIVPVETTGRLTLTDVGTMVGACVAGAGIAQVLALGVEHLIENGDLIELFPEWPGETFPLFVIRPSRRLPPAAVEAFLDFCGEICEAVKTIPKAS